MEDRLFLLVRDKDASVLSRWFAENGKGVDCNVRNDQGQTPLYWACESDEVKVFSFVTFFTKKNENRELPWQRCCWRMEPM